MPVSSAAEERRYRELTRHPVTELLRRAASGETVYPDEVADLRLSGEAREAFDEALERLATPYTNASGEEGPILAPIHPDRSEGLTKLYRYSDAVVSALPDSWEDRRTHEERRAGLGDADALANVKAREEGYSALADKIDKGY